MTSLEDNVGAAAELAAAGQAGPALKPPSSSRNPYLRDGFALLALSLITVALFGVTLFLFKSFEAHRADLGRRWSGRGRLALAQGHPDQAAAALRTALSYAPDDYEDQLLLAQALAGAGHLEAADNYFLSLWEVHPGDGFLNLQLARLVRRRGEAPEAVNYYRASIFGNWEQNGVERRRAVRLELADYLAERGQGAAAQAELLISAGNAPEKDVPLQLELADRLRALGDLPDALRLYKQAAAQEPRSLQALADEGRTEYALGEYPAAVRSLSAAAEVAERSRSAEGEVKELAQLQAAARRLPELSLSRELPAGERAEHILLDAGVAQSRLRACTAQLQPVPVVTAGIPAKPAVTAPPISQAAATVLSGLRTRWAAEGRALNRRALARDAAREDAVAQLINDTETGLAPLCGAPAGDDALLLQLAQQASPDAGGAR